jgi:hypothetical protein
MRQYTTPRTEIVSVQLTISILSTSRVMQIDDNGANQVDAW